MMDDDVRHACRLTCLFLVLVGVFVCLLMVGCEPPDPSFSYDLRTVRYDGHDWVIDRRSGTQFTHHPDCPCGWHSYYMLYDN